MSSETDKSVPSRHVPLVASFDALWFCFSPVHQLQQYYRLGKLDNCSEKWNALVDCFVLKTKRSGEVQEILEAREKVKRHIWTFRTPEEASVHWKGLFGHLDDME
ncbi:hypothetical protein HS088_TW11G01030 [Tripterygium wilfordii]|uniref:Uncharacterized protein n=1 Tax=Tripterygium wilfordii TaxID=458696 RepID=A0A7J7D3V2_TRIWF|nr:uncharacterized protein LOC120009216 [Tripterygium wilfordii]KAF5740948.1 hypothetical protein HS088_TW11G01030 [Tripterygium wilfordii]